MGTPLATCREIPRGPARLLSDGDEIGMRGRKPIRVDYLVVEEE